MLFIEADLDQCEQVRNEPEIARREKGLQQIAARLAKGGHRLPFAYSAFRQLTQRGVKVIRWLRNHLYRDCSWPAAVSHLRRLYAARQAPPGASEQLTGYDDTSEYFST
jgi:hypothetical protein